MVYGCVYIPRQVFVSHRQPLKACSLIYQIASDFCVCNTAPFPNARYPYKDFTSSPRHVLCNQSLLNRPADGFIIFTPSCVREPTHRIKDRWLRRLAERRSMPENPSPTGPPNCTWVRILHSTKSVFPLFRTEFWKPGE
jgi:hypothetical protein